jgi:hypothetical protein
VRLIYLPSFSLDASALADSLTSPPSKVVFVGFDIAMSGLNFLWFFKMAKAMGRRLRGEKKPVAGGKRDAVKEGLSAPVSKGEKQE